MGKVIHTGTMKFYDVHRGQFVFNVTVSESEGNVVYDCFIDNKCVHAEDVKKSLIESVKKYENDFRFGETCCECGRSVALGSGRFVNRIHVLDDYETKKDEGRPYPYGAFMCAECDEKLRIDE